MSLYDKIKPLKEQGKTFAEIAATAGLNDNPRLVPLADLNEILLASGAWAILQRVAAGDNAEQAGLAATTLGLFAGKLNNFDARKPEYATMLDNVLALLAGYGVSDAYVDAINSLCGFFPNPTAEEVESAWVEGQWQEQRLAVEQQIDAKYQTFTDAYNAAKLALGQLNSGDTIPTIDELWA